MNFQKVVIKKDSSSYSATKDVLKELDLDLKSLQDKKILIKPNAGRHVDPDKGINTSPTVIAGIIDFLLESKCKNIFIGESPILGVKALESLEKCGISKIARDRNIPLVDLDEKKPVIVDIPDGRVIKKLKICQEVLEADYIISAPLMKTHMHTQVTLGLKNMKGCLYKKEKVKLHQLPFTKNLAPNTKPLDQAIADMADVLMPDLVIIDGSTCLEGMGPSAGSPKKMNMIIGSENCLAADWIAAELMGFEPNQIPHISLAIQSLKKKKPQFDLSSTSIEAIPSDYKKWIDPFQLPPDKISLEYANIKIEDKDSCSACQSTLMMFLKRNYQKYADYFSEDNPLRFAMGKAIGKQKKNTLLIGNCTFNQKEGCVFVKGCPPVASEIKKELDKILPEIKSK